MHFCVFKRITN